jgi:hypothetical protein
VSQVDDCGVYEGFLANEDKGDEDGSATDFLPSILPCLVTALSPRTSVIEESSSSLERPQRTIQYEHA